MHTTPVNVLKSRLVLCIIENAVTDTVTPQSGLRTGYNRNMRYVYFRLGEGEGTSFTVSVAFLRPVLKPV